MKPNPKTLPPLRSRLAAAAMFLVSVLPSSAQTIFRVNSEAGNTSGSILTLDHPALNGKPKAKPLITQFWSGVYNANPVGVQYNTTSARWQIVNENGVGIPANAKFNVLIAKGTKTDLASAANSSADITVFPTAKGKPEALLLSTHVTNPVLSFPPTYSERYHGLYYVPAGPAYGNQWSIFTEDGDNMETLGFHVADVSKIKIDGNPASFVFTAAGANISGHVATIDNPLTNNNPNAFIYIQHAWLPGAGAHVDHPVGIYYASNRWRIFLQDFADMPNNAAFVVAVFPGTGL
jgi:hypothetical protein